MRAPGKRAPRGARAVSAVAAVGRCSVRTECRRRSPRQASCRRSRRRLPVADRLPRRRRRAKADGTATAARHLVVAASAFARAADQLHPVGHDLGRVLLDAVLVGVLARLQPALDVDRAALLQVLARDLRLAAEQDDAVPLGAFLLLAALVLPLLGRRDVEVGDRIAAGRVARLRIAAQVAEQDHLVHRCHLVRSFPSKEWIPPPPAGSPSSRPRRATTPPARHRSRRPPRAPHA